MIEQEQPDDDAMAGRAIRRAHAGGQPSVHDRGGDFARDWHRRELRDRQLRRRAAAPAAAGRTVRINGVPFAVIGVAPSEFTGMNQYVRSDFFVPLMMSPRILNDPRTASLQARDARNLRVKGRLKPGVSQSKAQAELNAIAA